jgi:hypothetical protein
LSFIGNLIPAIRVAPLATLGTATFSTPVRYTATAAGFNEAALNSSQKRGSRNNAFLIIPFNRIPIIGHLKY